MTTNTTSPVQAPIYWRVTPRSAGNIFQKHLPQLAGTYEGEEGQGAGLILYTDASDRSWMLLDTRLGRIADGHSPAPTVPEAMRIRERAKIGRV